MSGGPDNIFDFPLWYAENRTILWNRLLLGDEGAHQLGNEILSPEEQLRIAQRHPKQAEAMLEARAATIMEERFGD